MILQRNIEQDIIQMAMLIKEKERYQEDIAEQINNLKEEIRGLMKEFGITQIANIDTDKVREIKINYPKSFDVGLLGKDYPELYTKYVSKETRIVEDLKINKKDLQRLYPKEYAACEVELTPRLTIK